MHERVVALERQCWVNNKYSRRECSEITGVPDSVNNDDLEETSIKNFDKLDVAVGSSNIENYHWLKSNRPKKVIITFPIYVGSGTKEKQTQGLLDLPSNNLVGK